MYRKARLLEYDKREAEKVQRNSRKLDRQRNTKLTSIVLTAVSVFVMIKFEVIDVVLLVLLSLLLIGIGLMVENTEFTWDQESD